MTQRNYVKIQNYKNNSNFLSEYRETDIGFLPVQWNISTIEEICVNKGLVRGPFGAALRKEFFVRDGYKVYEQKNAIYKDVDLGKYFIDNNKFIELKRFEIKEGDFIVSCSGTIGKIFRIPKDARKGVINQALLKIRIEPEKLDSEFFYQYFEWESFQKRIIDNTQGGAMRNLVSMTVFRNTLMPVPNIKEQQKIATILSTWDKAIELKEKLVQQKKEQKRGLMQKLLNGEVRLRGFDREWKEVRLGEVVTFANGKAHEKNIDEDGSYIVVNSKFISSEGSKYKCSNVTLFPLKKGDITMVMSDVPNGKALAKCFLIDEDNKYTLNQRICSLRVTKANNLFIFYAINRANYFIQFDNGVGQTNLRKEEVLNCPLNIPEIKEQEAITSVLSTADKEIDLHGKELEALKLQKKGLMQLLLTGIVRVVNK